MREGEKKKNNNFSSCLHRILPPSASSTDSQHQRFTSILGRASASTVRGWGEEDTHMGTTELVVCGRGLGDGRVGC